MDRMTLRWLSFCAVKQYPRDTNDILDEVYAQTGCLDATMGVGEELHELIDIGIVIVHAESDNVLEVRLNNDAA